MSDPDWRPVLAALANPDTRRLFAELVLDVPEPGAELSPSRLAHTIERLREAGMIGEGGMLDPSIFARVLASAPKREKPTGVHRFLTPDGRIDRYPAGADDRDALLVHIAGQVLARGEVVSERELTERLSRLTHDPAALRRYLVDAELVERTASGSQYALVAIRD